MKAKIREVLAVIVILSLLPIFMGQGECRLNENFKEEIALKIEIGGDDKNPLSVKIAYYPLLNQSAESEATLINNINYLLASLIQGFSRIYNSSQVTFHLKNKNINRHSVLEFDVTDNLEISKKILDILFNSRLNEDEKAKTIMNGVIGNKKPDIMMTGRCYEDLTGDLLTLEIAVLYKNRHRIEKKKITSRKEALKETCMKFRTFRLLYKDKLAKTFFKDEARLDLFGDKIFDELYKKTLTFFIGGDSSRAAGKPANDVEVTYDISGIGTGDEFFVNEETKQHLKIFNQKLPPPKPDQNKLYVTNLSFMDANSRSTMTNTEVMTLIDEAVQKGMRAAHKTNDKIIINERSHIIANTDANVSKLVSITFDPYIKKSDKLSKILNQLMNPGSVDIIVTGHYIEDGRDQVISIRPLVIVKANRRIVTKNLQFKKNELVCVDPISNKKTLCRGARNRIIQAVQELLEFL